MKKILLILIASSAAVLAETEEQVSKQFSVQSGGRVVVDVSFGSIDVRSHAANEVTVDVDRKVRWRSKKDEQTFLREHPVTFTQNGATVTIRSRGPMINGGFWRRSPQTQAHYVILVPSQFDADLTTAGGRIAAGDLQGSLKAATSGGGLEFARIHGSIKGNTSGGTVRLTECVGPQSVSTSGGGIVVSLGSGSLEGHTSGGTISVKDFQGPVKVETSGGGIQIENVAGKVEGSTSGGTITATFSTPPAAGVRLETSGGGVTVNLPGNAAFDLDAATSGGGVSSDLPVTIMGKPSRDHLKGPVNGGGKPVFLRSSGGGIRVRQR